MTSIIDNPSLSFLKYNNSYSRTKSITKNMIADNILLLKFDMSMFYGKNLLSVYWKFCNLDMEDTHISISNTNYYKDTNYYAHITPVQDCLAMNYNSNINDYIYFLNFTFENPRYIFSELDFVFEKDFYNDFKLRIKKSKSKLKINSNSSIEIVFQYRINPNDLPYDLEILRIYWIDRIFENLPSTLKKIIIDDTRYDNPCAYWLEYLHSHLKKIPFGCSIVNRFNISLL